MSLPLVSVATAAFGLVAALTTGLIPESALGQEVFFGGIASCASALIMMVSAIET